MPALSGPFYRLAAKGSSDPLTSAGAKHRFLRSPDRSRLTLTCQLRGKVSMALLPKVEHDLHGSEAGVIDYFNV